MKNNFIFIPAMSAGAMFSMTKAKRQFKNGMTADFYNWDNEFRYPYFLITAGHFYKRMNIGNDVDFFKYNDTEIFGDSGGFQIITGKIDWEKNRKETRQLIFNWLEQNSTIAANLDIPPRSQLYNFNESLEMSIDNFKFFHDNMSGSTKYLNVIHGNNVDSFNKWYEGVKDFPNFSGWAFGGLGVSLSKFMAALYVILHHDLHLKSEVLHFLGISSLSYFILMAHFQQALNKITDIQIYSDSSSPNSARFGQYYTHPNYKSLSWDSIHIPYLREGEKGKYDKNMSGFFDNEISDILPLTTEFDKKMLLETIDHDDIIQYSPRFCSILSIRNVFVYKECVDDLNEYVKLPEYVRNDIFNKDISKLGTLIDEMVRISDNKKLLKQVFDKNSSFLKTFRDTTFDNKKVQKHNFFN